MVVGFSSFLTTIVAAVVFIFPFERCFNDSKRFPLLYSREVTPPPTPKANGCDVASKLAPIVGCPDGVPEVGTPDPSLSIERAANDFTPAAAASNSRTGVVDNDLEPPDPLRPYRVPPDTLFVP